MKRLQVRIIVLCVAALLVAAAGPSPAQESLTASPTPSGVIQVLRGEAELARIDLNAHGPGWEHAPQDTATAQMSDLPDGDGVKFDGSLPIPNTEGGAIEFTETVEALSQGLRLEYNLTMAQTMRLNGLQLSILLPADRYGDAEVTILHPHADPEIAGLPEEHREGQTQLWSGAGATINVAPETEDAVTAELRAATDVMIQDLREWEHQVFEVRFPAIMEAGGLEVSEGDRFHIDLTVTFAGPVSLQKSLP